MEILDRNCEQSKRLRHRIQIVKDWLDAAGRQHENIFDVPWSGDCKIGKNGSLPPVGTSVDLKTATDTDKSAPGNSCAPVGARPHRPAHRRAGRRRRGGADGAVSGMVDTRVSAVYKRPRR